MHASLFEKDQRLRSVRNERTRWAGDVALAVAVGAAFYLVARITSWGTTFQPDNVALFWPPTGVSCGLLIVLGPRRRWPAVVGIVAASALINHTSWNNPWITPAIAVCNAVEALTVAGLFTYYFGSADFPLDRVRKIFGLLGAAAVGAFVSSLIATAVLRLALGSSIVVVSTLQHWFASVFVGIVTVTPLVIGLADAVRHPPSRRECLEGSIALLSLALVTALIISLSQESWEVLLPVAWPFPILLWLAGRLRPVFAAAGAFLVSNIIVWTTNFGVGHFGDPNPSLDNRVLEAQTAILFLAVSAYVLAALFAERRESEARLARSNLLLERERSNRLMNIDAITASIAHEVRQPLAAIVNNGEAARILLERTPPDLSKADAVLRNIVGDSLRINSALDSTRALFRRFDQENDPIDLNTIAFEVLESARGELSKHGVTARSSLATDLPLIRGKRNQLHQVLLNLVNNALEAMSETTDRSRVLLIRTELEGRDAVALCVEDTGPGIRPEQLSDIFEAFVTTKPQGMGLGLAICRTIVESHGGQLTVSSDGKSGARFRMVLPRNSHEIPA